MAKTILQMSDVKDQFLRLRDKWDYETRYMSSANYYDVSPAFREIVHMGEIVLPYILEDMSIEPKWWFQAIYKIVGDENCPDIPLEAQGRLDEVTKIYLKWGKERGYYDPDGP